MLQLFLMVECLKKIDCNCKKGDLFNCTKSAQCDNEVRIF